MNDEALKQYIDSCTYEQLLRRWRFAEIGDPYFQGEVGKYYQQVMNEKAEEIGKKACSKASKDIGWDK